MREAAFLQPNVKASPLKRSTQWITIGMRANVVSGLHLDLAADIGLVSPNFEYGPPQPPWHGYSLGDWDEAWERYAERAVEGRWQESGGETFARRRGGLTPETPVREVEGKGGGET